MCSSVKMAFALLAIVMSLSWKLSGHSKLKKSKMEIYYGDFQSGGYMAFEYIFSARVDMLNSWVLLLIAMMLGYLNRASVLTKDYF